MESSTLVKYMFARAFYYNDVDYAGAIGCVLIVALTAVALVGLWTTERGPTHEESPHNPGPPT